MAMQPDPWARGMLIALLHLLLPFLCARKTLEMLHQDGNVTRTCIACGRHEKLDRIGDL